jgi:hypothetical protein
MAKFCDDGGYYQIGYGNVRQIVLEGHLQDSPEDHRIQNCVEEQLNDSHRESLLLEIALDPGEKENERERCSRWRLPQA